MNILDRSKIDEMHVYPSSTIKETMQTIGKGEIGTAFIVDPKDNSFIGIITDGDIRRAILDEVSLDTEIESLPRPDTLSATTKMDSEEISCLFNEKIRIIPIVDENNHIVDVAFYDKRFRLPVSSPTLGGNELNYVTDCIKTNWVSSTGKYVTKFESLFAEYCGTNYAIATSNGTTALHLALLVLGVGPGDEVIVPTLSFIATANAVLYVGAKPVFVDSDTESWNIDPTKIKRAITPKTKAIIPVHLYGHPADMDPIMKIAEEYNLKVIEDAAEAHGAKYKGKIVGSIGDIGIFSFFGNKIITTGEGGMLITDDTELTERVKILRDHGMSKETRYLHTVLGYNYRLTNLQAAVGVAQIEQIESILRLKLDVANQYTNQLQEIKGITLPPLAPWATNVYWLYSILIEDEYGMTRDELMEKLSAMDIETRPLFIPIHMQPIYNTKQKLKTAEDLSKRGLSLPSFAGLHYAEVDRICSAIKHLKQKPKKQK